MMKECCLLQILLGALRINSFTGELYIYICMYIYIYIYIYIIQLKLILTLVMQNK